MIKTKRKTTIALIKIKILLGLLFALVIMFTPNMVHASVIAESTTEELEKTNAEVTIDDDFSDNFVTVTLTKEATRQFLNYTPESFAEVRAIAITDLTSVTVDWVRKKVFGIPTQEKMSINIEKFRRILSIELAEKSKENVLNAVSILNQRADIEVANPNYIQQITSVTANDTYRNDQWGINNANIHQAWHLATGNSKVIVGVLDSGIDATHPDLTNRIYRDTSHSTANTLHRDFTSGEVNGAIVLEPEDPHGHGTHVAGTIGAQGNNGFGVVGVAWDIRLVSLRVFNAEGKATTHDWLINAIYYAASKEIPILNYSGGGTTRNDSVRIAIDAYEGLFVAAAGNLANDNDSSTSHFPASFRLDNLISVGSINSNNERSSFSNWGTNSVDIWAPGSHIYSTFPRNKCIEGNCDDPSNEHMHRFIGYHSMSGTSMAAPHVAGVAALMLSVNPDLTPQQLRTNLLNNSNTITINVPDPGFWPWQWNDTKSISVQQLNAQTAVSAIAIFDTRVLSNTTIEIRGTFGKQLTGNVDIPSRLNNRDVIAIGNSAFANQSQMSQISIPISVTSIGYGAFQGCSNLKTITIPFVGNTLNGTSNTNFGYIFGATRSSGQNNYIPASLKEAVILGGGEIKNSAFYECSNIKQITLPRVTSIGEYAFYRCRSLISLEIPSSVTSIGESAFSGCSSLTSINIPSGVSVIEDATFIDCISLTSIYISYGVTKIKENVFTRCSSLSYIEIPDSVIHMGHYTFYECRNLTNVKLSNKLTSIEEFVFAGCWNLTSIIIPNSVTSMLYTSFYECRNLMIIEISKNLSIIEWGTFIDCINLKNVIFNGITYLDYYAFPDSNRKFIVPYSTIEHYEQYLGEFCSSISYFTGSHNMKITDYNYPQQYYFDEITNTYNFTDLTLITNRLRTGFIEKEYIVLSPRRANAGIAYLEYKFSRPITHINVDLALWSASELLRSSDCTAVFQYKDSNGNWVNKIDLLNDITLTTDRKNPINYTIIFDEPVTEYRFYLTAPQIGASNNTGRFCIGNMNVFYL